MLVYCMKCRKKETIAEKYFVKTKKNKYLVKGVCKVCGCRMSGLISKAHYEMEKE